MALVYHLFTLLRNRVTPIAISGSGRHGQNFPSGASQQRISGLARPGTMEPPEHTHKPMAASSDEAGIRCSLALHMAVRGLTVRRLAEEAGVHLAAVSRLRGNRFSMLDAKTVSRICRYLQLEVGDLLYLDPPLENADGD